MKKIIALCASAIMLFSTVASAAIVTEEDGFLYATLTDKATIESRQINMDAAVTHLTYAEATTAGINKNGPQTFAEADYDFYKLEMDITGIGELFDAWYVDGEDFLSAQLNLRAIALNLEMPKVKKVALGSGTYNNVAFGNFNFDTVGNAYSTVWDATSDTNCWPAVTDDHNTVIGNASMEDLVYYFAVAKTEGEATVIDNVGITFQATYYMQFGNNQGTEPKITNLNVAATCNGTSTGKTLKFAPVVQTPTYPIEMTVTEKEDTATGYIWALAFGANKDKLASLTATFEDGVREAFVANIPAAAVTAVTGGTTTINVGLKTGATLTGATFVAGNSDVNTEATTQVLYK